MDNSQQYVDPYRTLVPSAQPDQLHAPQFHHQPQLLKPPPLPQHNHPSLASHFHLLHLVTRLADAIETGTRDQHFDALVDELINQFGRCQQLLNSISGTISTKSMTVAGEKHNLEEITRQLDQRKDLFAKYRSCIEDLNGIPRDG